VALAALPASAGNAAASATLAALKSFGVALGSEIAPSDDPLAFAERTKEADSIDVLSEEFDAALTAFLDAPDDSAPEDRSDGSDGPTGPAST